MKTLTKDFLVSAFTDALESTRHLGLQDGNKLRSARFVECVGESLFKLYKYSDLKEYYQRCDLKNLKKTSGEWLLDAVICNVHSVWEAGTPNRYNCRIGIEWAVESEYNTSLKEFLEDFSKLLNIQAKNKLYLNGYCSNDMDRFSIYTQRRLATAAELIKKYNSSGQFYFGFWPSPQIEKASSFWHSSKNLLNILRIYQFEHEKSEWLLLN